MCKTVLIIAIGMIARLCLGQIYVSPSGSDINSGHYGSPVRSLDVGVLRAGQHGILDIRVEEGLYLPNNGLSAVGSGCTITLDSLTMSGGWRSGFTERGGTSVLSGGGVLFHVMTASQIHSLTFTGFTLVAGKADLTGCPPWNGVGGGIFLHQVEGSTVTDCLITDCYATNSGGGMAMVECDNNVVDVVLEGNFAEDSGGGLFVNASAQNDLGIVARGNQSALKGGGIHSLWGRDNAFHVQLSQNTSLDGGGISLEKEWSPTLTGDISDNLATRRGGGVQLERTTNAVIHIMAVENKAKHPYYAGSREGGGLYAFADTDTVIEGAFLWNLSQYRGGAIYSFASEGMRISADVIGNKSGTGGGIFLLSSRCCLIQNCNVSENEAIDGLGLYLDIYDCDTTVMDCTFNDNACLSTNGGAVIVLGEPIFAPGVPLPTGHPFIAWNSIGGAPQRVSGQPIATGIKEQKSMATLDQSQHYLIENSFDRSELKWLYNDFTNGTTAAISMVNSTNYSGAAVTMGNTTH